MSHFLAGTALVYIVADVVWWQNKDKPKKGSLPKLLMDEKRYEAARTVGDVWICYPWEAIDIEAHDEMARQQAVAKK